MRAIHSVVVVKRHLFRDLICGCNTLYVVVVCISCTPIRILQLPMTPHSSLAYFTATDDDTYNEVYARSEIYSLWI